MWVQSYGQVFPSDDEQNSFKRQGQLLFKRRMLRVHRAMIHQVIIQTKSDFGWCQMQSINNVPFDHLLLLWDLIPSSIPFLLLFYPSILFIFFLSWLWKHKSWIEWWTFMDILIKGWRKGRKINFSCRCLWNPRTYQFVVKGIALLLFLLWSKFHHSSFNSSLYLAYVVFTFFFMNME